MTALPPTAGQTVGPFFKFGLEFEGMAQVAFPHSPGAIVLGGSVLDGNGTPIPDAVVEIFGADADGSVPRARGSLRRDGHTQLVYKHAISTVMPGAPIMLFDATKAEAPVAAEAAADANVG